MNIALLYFFFSMEGKDAARNSLFVVFISQFASLASTLLQQRVPGFLPYELLALLDRLYRWCVNRKCVQQANDQPAGGAIL